MDLDPKFNKWLQARKVAQKAPVSIPTNNVNPTLKAGPKNSNGPKRGSAKSTVTVPMNSIKDTTISRSTQPKAVAKTGVPNLKKSASVARPKGKVRASNNPRLSSRIG